MDTFEAIETRRSVKHYDPDHKMSHEEIDRLMDLTLLSPTSFNMQNWRFVVAQDKGLRLKLCEASWNQAQVSEASIVVVLCGDLNAHDREPHRYWANAPQQVQDMLVPMITKFYSNQDALQRDEVMRSVGLAGQTLMLAARAMGYDSCPMIGFDQQKVAELIHLPEDHILGMMITVGKALTPAQPRGGQLPRAEVVFRDGFPG